MTAIKEYVIVAKNEYKLKTWEIVLSEKDVQDLIEYQDVFTKFLQKSIHKLQSDLASLEYVGSEQKIYAGIHIIQELIKALEQTIKEWKEFKKNNE